MLGSAACFTLYLSAAKLLASRYDPGLLAFQRTAIAAVITAPWALQAGAAFFRLKRPGLVLLRSGFSTAGYVCTLFAVGQLPLSQLNAITFSRSLFIVILAAWLLKERVGPHRWSATAVGFIGVLVMVAPHNGDWGSLSVGSFWAVGSALSFAAAIVLVKELSRDHTPAQLLLWANAISTLFTAPFAINSWAWPSSSGDFALIVLMAVAGLAAQGCYIRGLNLNDASFVSVIDYLRLPMTAAVDWVVFRALPPPAVWLGAIIVVLASSYIVWREHKRASSLRSKQNPVEPP